VYAYDRTSSIIHATVKFTDLSPNIVFDQNKITLKTLIELVAEKLAEDQMKSKDKVIKNPFSDVDALRGSLPVPTTISEKMIVVKPNSTNKQTAIELSNLTNRNPNQDEQWFDTTNNLFDLFECSICCETLISHDAYQLLPCMYFHISTNFNYLFSSKKT
jgi:hypothetical protein